MYLYFLLVKIIYLRVTNTIIRSYRKYTHKLNVENYKINTVLNFIRVFIADFFHTKNIILYWSRKNQSGLVDRTRNPNLLIDQIIAQTKIVQTYIIPLHIHNDIIRHALLIRVERLGQIIIDKCSLYIYINASSCSVKITQYLSW